MSALTRRHFFGAAASMVAAAAAPRVAFAQAPAPAATGPFTVPPLAYAFNALEPHIDARTMEIHHDRHHGAYVANLNNLAKSNPQLGTSAVTDVLGNLNALNDDIKFAVRNNLGGHANHTMFWHIMAPGGGKPEGEVLAAIDKDLGGLKIPERLPTPRVDGSSGRAGIRHSSPRTASLRSKRVRTRTIRSWTASALCSATTSGNTPIISTTRTAAPII
jgi:hypothetical protein